MKLLPTKAKLPAGVAALSLISLLLILFTTSPFNKIGYAILFFALLAIFLISSGYFVSIVQFGKVDRPIRYRIVLISLFLVIFLMFRSTQSLTWVDALVLILIIFGLLFYINRRSP